MEDERGSDPVDEAYNLLQNGILVETNKGVICMSLNDALSSDLNLSVEDLKNVVTQLISQQKVSTNVKDKVYLKQTSNLSFDSDGFSSECSDVTNTTIASSTCLQPTFITFSSLSNEIKAENKPPYPTASTTEPKFVTFMSRGIDLKILGPDVSALNKNIPSGSGISDSDTSISIDNTNSDHPEREEAATDSTPINIDVHKPPKRRGGWPKGRKRKPELLNLPPKAPATGYNLYLNEQRKLFKDSKLVFHEITKVIGNKWSNLSLEDKRPYLAKAEEDKRRYREELKQYRQSDAYRAYLAKKRKNRLKNNVMSESDMDATDEIDDEDNEELYCRTCDQWFHNLHNKREHLQGKQHIQSVAGDIRRQLDSETRGAPKTRLFNISEDDSRVDGGFFSDGKSSYSGKLGSVGDSMANLVNSVYSREMEIKLLQERLQETFSVQNSLCQELSLLKQKHVKLKSDLSGLKNIEGDMEAKVSNLWQVPNWFIITDFSIEKSFVNERRE